MKSPIRFKKKLLAGLIATAVMSVATAPTMLRAASSDANLRGKATPNAVVTAKEISTGATRRTTAGSDGSYALVGLPPGTYQVDAGAGTERTVTLTVASTASLDLTSAPAPGAANATNLNSVTVSATTLQEVKTSEVGDTVSLREINATPAASRNFLEFADAVPGMIFTRSSNGNTSLRSGAQFASGTNIYIDGVGQKNYVLGGGGTGQNNSQGNPFPQLAIAEYKVITSNYKAEYDQVSSAAVTAETKSGTNEFHGDVFGDFTNTAMRAETPSEQATGKKTVSHEKNYGFDLGGPILKDQAHFYIAYEGKEFDSPITVVPGVSGYNAALPASAQALLGPASNPFRENNWFGKIDWEPTDRDRFEVSAKYRDETAISGVGGTSAATAAVNTLNKDKRADLRWDHSTDSWFNRLQATYEDASYHPVPILTGDGAQYVATDLSQTQTILVTGAGPLSEQDKGQKGPSLQDDLTFNDLEWNGDHVIKLGVKFKAVKLSALDSGDSNALYSYSTTAAGTESIPYSVQFGSPTPGFNPTASSSDRQFGAYVQDDWAIDDHWTLNLGVRWDYEKTPSYLNFVTPANVVAAFNSQDPNAPAGQTYAQSLAKGGVDVNDYISTGNNRKAQKNEFQPRLGFSDDIFGDEEHVVFGGIGRSYNRNLYEALQVEQTKSALSQPTLNFNTAGVPCVVGINQCFAWDPAYLNIPNLQALVSGSNVGKEVDLVSNNIKTPYSDQISIGMRNKIGDWNTSVTLARVKSFDGLYFHLGNRYPNGAFWQNGSQPWNNGVPGFGSLIIADSGLETKTENLLLSADKPYTKESGWGASIAYTYTHSLYNHNNNNPDDQYAFDYESAASYPFISSDVPKHRLVVTGSLDGPWGFLFGGKLTLATPSPSLGQAFYGLPTSTQDHDGISGGGGQALSLVPPGEGRFLVGGKVFGYRDIDLQATKNFNIYAGISAYLRIDVINLFNWNNYEDYLTSYGANGQLSKTPVMYNPTGNITGYPRTLRVSMGFKF
ncbi:TonB-dependent receptor [Rhodanobacter sp. L36]|uniref:TonB-dependent receptor n=1 Tax=Rhodanobacter sp. L36 TaxID=1747221 RepID=UPI00131DC136|nr:TonB-dependent receptor [Rhodanobacter sp. L36]